MLKKKKNKKVAPKKKKTVPMFNDKIQEIFTGIHELDGGETLKAIALWCFIRQAGKIKDVPLEIWEMLADDLGETIFANDPDDEVAGLLFLAISNALKTTKKYLYHDDSMSMELLEEVFPRWLLLVQWYFALREENEKNTKLDDVIFFDTKFLAEMDIKKIEDEISDIYERNPEDEDEDYDLF
jgi:hypothetical protein